MEAFKSNLELFKNSNILIDTGNFWEVSNEVLHKIEGPHYLLNKQKHNEYLLKEKGVLICTETYKEYNMLTLDPI